MCCCHVQEDESKRGASRYQKPPTVELLQVRALWSLAVATPSRATCL
eukprot:COSAG01_NODE_4957_length_4590_cov_3.176130_6_plen_47_part_00